ncbi:NADPH-dependent FMN reductase [Flavobacterium soyangense]|uniref:NAD(P)H-dependent oxidoreductase n=1 Tax=Flavobacterium soyangense TaxID=2023265 RepID=A0A930UF62_9FLAO|nr:NAD(P)H-dependent oxidoreductase [Flavobacterium soyangense]MBF2709664.1 NAD(P)H-dependent oxidoreductase [Flavobacterium soyangense]
MKIIAFAGSNSKNSINKKLATYAASLFVNAEVEVLDLNDFQMPLFGVDIEKEIGQHPLAKAFLDKIFEADILVVSLAENNGNYSAAFKNVFDWCSRITPKIFQEKPMLLMATSPGARGGISVLEIAKNTFPRFGAILKATFSLPSFNDNFDVEKGQISNVELDKQLREIVNNFQVF